LSILNRISDINSQISQCTLANMGIIAFETGKEIACSTGKEIA